ncbi:hypothetical protein J6590_011874 [Homalodisca vitripennis]|nr:hypothetical protein J6590_011874 [Homalodisca vitripennis]
MVENICRSRVALQVRTLYRLLHTSKSTVTETQPALLCYLPLRYHLQEIQSSAAGSNAISIAPHIQIHSDRDSTSSPVRSRVALRDRMLYRLFYTSTSTTTETSQLSNVTYHCTINSRRSRVTVALRDRMLYRLFYTLTSTTTEASQLSNVTYHCTINSRRSRVPVALRDRMLYRLFYTSTSTTTEASLLSNVTYHCTINSRRSRLAVALRDRMLYRLFYTSTSTTTEASLLPNVTYHYAINCKRSRVAVALQEVQSSGSAADRMLYRLFHTSTSTVTETQPSLPCYLPLRYHLQEIQSSAAGSNAISIASHICYLPLTSIPGGQSSGSAAGSNAISIVLHINIHNNRG